MQNTPVENWETTFEFSGTPLSDELKAAIVDGIADKLEQFPVDGDFSITVSKKKN